MADATTRLVQVVEEVRRRWGVRAARWGEEAVPDVPLLPTGYVLFLTQRTARQTILCCLARFVCIAHAASLPFAGVAAHCWTTAEQGNTATCRTLATRPAVHRRCLASLCARRAAERASIRQLATRQAHPRQCPDRCVLLAKVYRAV